jgi:hypothetical protein
MHAWIKWTLLATVLIIWWIRTRVLFNRARRMRFREMRGLLEQTPSMRFTLFDHVLLFAIVAAFLLCMMGP